MQLLKHFFVSKDKVATQGCLFQVILNSRIYLKYVEGRGKTNLNFM